MIEKLQSNTDNFRIHMFYYNRARDAMKDIVEKLVIHGFEYILIPGYIGWSPREGSGIFDPLNSITGLNRQYYHMNKELRIDIDSLKKLVREHSILLVVNYFGFRDPNIKEIIDFAHKSNCVVIEDNAHGFYTYFYYGSIGSDMTFFSLHKMFPFPQGGSLLIEKGEYLLSNNIKDETNFNPLEYNYNEISRRRIRNYKLLMSMSLGKEKYFIPLKREKDLKGNVPQTFPILINKGDRNKIYEIMNNSGFGVVSLYHTMIEELQNDKHAEACWISERIMNLPVHQDVDINEYPLMIEKLESACDFTS